MKIKNLVLRMIRAAIGLVLFAFGTYLTVQADIGLAPWDAFAIGISKQFPITYGKATVVISLGILLVDFLLKERIGIGTIMDALIVGNALDIFMKVDPVSRMEQLWQGILLMTVGMLIMAYSQYLYMSAALCCGPRDSFLVAVGKRLRKVPIGAVNILILAVVLLIGYVLGGPVGIGTVYSVAGIGVAMQIVFSIVLFEPREIEHDGLTLKKNNIK